MFATDFGILARILEDLHKKAKYVELESGTLKPAGRIPQPFPLRGGGTIPSPSLKMPFVSSAESGAVISQNIDSRAFVVGTIGSVRPCRDHRHRILFNSPRKKRGGHPLRFNLETLANAESPKAA